MDGLVSDCGGEAESATGTGIVPVPETDLLARGGSFAGCLRVGRRCAIRSSSPGRRVESGGVSLAVASSLLRRVRRCGRLDGVSTSRHVRGANDGSVDGATASVRIRDRSHSGSGDCTSCSGTSTVTNDSR